MTTKNIQDVVAELTSRLARYKLTEKNNEKEIIFVSGLSREDEDWPRTTLTQLVKEVEAGERERIAEIVGGAGDNSISTLRSKDFTGTYWISANNLYRELTGIHLNKAREDGTIVNTTFNEIDEEALTPPTSDVTNQQT